MAYQRPIDLIDTIEQHRRLVILFYPFTECYWLECLTAFAKENAEDYAKVRLEKADKYKGKTYCSGRLVSRL